MVIFPRTRYPGEPAVFTIFERSRPSIVHRQGKRKLGLIGRETRRLFQVRGTDADAKEDCSMLKNALRSGERLYRERSRIVCIIAAIIVLGIDYITGKNIDFPIVYALPVGLAAWGNQKNTAYGMAILLPLMRVGFYFPWHETGSFPVALFNAPIKELVLVLYAYLIDRTAWQARALEKKVSALEGILPICASCKRIRNERGEYEQIEKYVTEHSEASFTHGICPDCAGKLYPDYFKDGEQK